eukprot:m.110340 g.110340  ORF g.110340 m.110340 type:complete len:1457 (+) comp9219_c0_seq15:71-4441(+)
MSTRRLPALPKGAQKRTKKKREEDKKNKEEKMGSSSRQLLHRDNRVRVAVRVRPFNASEKKKCNNIISMVGNEATISSDKHPQGKSFYFDDCLWSHETNDDHYVGQSRVFERIGLPLVHHALEGYNCCILAYGQTSSGKTHSLMGDLAATAKEDDCMGDRSPGVLPRFIQTLLRFLEEDTVTSGFKLSLSFCEIYNETVHDLLESSASHLQIMNKEVQGLSEYPVADYNTIKLYIERGLAQRATADNGINFRSSRSHAIFSLKLTRMVEEDGEKKTKYSRIVFADLAGSENLKIAKRNKEMKFINQSLLALGQVIRALVEMKRPSYRSSKLTRLLESSIGGNSKTVMLATISPSNTHNTETLSTLRYASEMKKIINRARINEDVSTRTLREMQAKINMLEEELLDAQSSNNEEEVDRLESYIQALTREKSKSEESWTHQLAEMQANVERQLADAKENEAKLQADILHLEQQNQNNVERFAKEKKEMEQKYAQELKIKDEKHRIEMEEKTQTLEEELKLMREKLAKMEQQQKQEKKSIEAVSVPTETTATTPSAHNIDNFDSDQDDSDQDDSDADDSDVDDSDVDENLPLRNQDDERKRLAVTPPLTSTAITFSDSTQTPPQMISKATGSSLHACSTIETNNTIDNPPKLQPPSTKSTSTSKTTKVTSSARATATTSAATKATTTTINSSQSIEPLPTEQESQSKRLKRIVDAFVSSSSLPSSSNINIENKKKKLATFVETIKLALQNNEKNLAQLEAQIAGKLSKITSLSKQLAEFEHRSTAKSAENAIKARKAIASVEKSVATLQLEIDNVHVESDHCNQLLLSLTELERNLNYFISRNKDFSSGDSDNDVFHFSDSDVERGDNEEASPRADTNTLTTSSANSIPTSTTTARNTQHQSRKCLQQKSDDDEANELVNDMIRENLGSSSAFTDDLKMFGKTVDQMEQKFMIVSKPLRENDNSRCSTSSFEDQSFRVKKSNSAFRKLLNKSGVDGESDNDDDDDDEFSLLDRVIPKNPQATLKLDEKEATHKTSQQQTPMRLMKSRSEKAKKKKVNHESCHNREEDGEEEEESDFEFEKDEIDSYVTSRNLMGQIDMYINDLERVLEDEETELAQMETRCAYSKNLEENRHRFLKEFRIKHQDSAASNVQAILEAYVTDYKEAKRQRKKMDKDIQEKMIVLEKLRGYRRKVVQEQQRLAEVAKKELLAINVIFIVDLTTSMKKFFDDFIHQSLDQVIVNLHNAKKNLGLFNLNLGFVSYQDFHFADDGTCTKKSSYNIHRFFSADNSDNVKVFMRWMKSLDFEDGDDEPEDVVGGLEEAKLLFLQGPPALTNVIVHIGDAPCHGNKFHDLADDNLPDGDERDILEAIEHLRSLGVDYYFAQLNRSTAKMASYFSNAYSKPQRVFSSLSTMAGVYEQMYLNSDQQEKFIQFMTNKIVDSFISRQEERDQMQRGADEVAM